MVKKIDSFIRVDIQQIVKLGGKLVEVYGAVLHGDSFKINPFRKVIDKLLFSDRKLKMKILLLCSC